MPYPVVPPSALVTGAGGGIGSAIARELASRGYLTILCGRNETKLAETAAQIAEAGGRAIVRRLDVTDADAIDHLADDLSRDDLSPHVLVNNSGVSGQNAKLWELSPDDWDQTNAVNVRGVFLCCRAFLPAMIARGSGSIVTIGSATGKAPYSQRTPYATTKSALIGLTRTLAVDAGAFGVRVNLISPANVEGARLNWALANRALADGLDEARVRELMTVQSAMKRFVSPEEVARVVAFLAGDDSSAITGEDINVSAGFVMY